ncbi:DUF167 domain-containing protein [Patescibacteria group bacterium]
MKIFVKTKTGLKEEKIEKINKNYYLVFVKARPEKRKANAAIIKILSRCFKTTLAEINIVSGITSRQKIIEIKG